MGIASLILGIIGLAGLIPLIGWLFIIFNILAIIFGLFGLKNKKEKGMAIAGIVMGAIPIVAKIITWILILITSFAG